MDYNNWGDNMGRARMHCGNVILEMVQVVYDTLFMTLYFIGAVFFVLAIIPFIVYLTHIETLRQENRQTPKKKP